MQAFERNGSHADKDLAAKAAVSHLQLALVNLELNCSSLASDDRAALRTAGVCLQQLACGRRVTKRQSRVSSCTDLNRGPSASRPLGGSVLESNGPPDVENLPTSPSGASLGFEVPPTFDACAPSLKTLPDLPLPSELVDVTRQDSPHAEAADGITVLSESQSSPELREAWTRKKMRESRIQEPWQQQILEVFDEIDKDEGGDGYIKSSELREALARLGISPAKSKKLFLWIDQDRNAQIDRDEWESMVSQMVTNDPPEAVKEFKEAIIKLKGEDGRLYPNLGKEIPRCMLPYDSTTRLSWDLFIMMLLCYNSVSLPFLLGFDDFMLDSMAHSFDVVESIIDCFFMVDIVINFQTTYVTSDNTHIVDRKKVAYHYIRTWFFLDLLSSLPLDLIFHTLPNLQVAKILKISKVSKAIKMLRFTMRTARMMKDIENNELFDQIMTESRMAIKLSMLTTAATLVCHWLACFMAASGSKYLDEYQDVALSLGKRYLAALYWAMTTMSTVGYGDITPGSDSERAGAIVAMFLGVVFYAYVVGSITSVISTADANTHAYHERLNLIQAWINHHNELPKKMARRIRRHFKQLLSTKTAIEDADLLRDLPPELRIGVSKYIIDDEVRHNNLFEGLSSTALAKLVPILEHTQVEVGERIVNSDEPGVAMFIILEGSAIMRRGSQETRLEAGDSFGEEIVLGLEERYSYSVTAASHMSIIVIQEIAFQDCFERTPALLGLMTKNFEHTSRPVVRSSNNRTAMLDAWGSRSTEFNH